MPGYRIVHTGSSRSFPAPHRFLDHARADGPVVVYIGAEAGAAFHPDPTRPAILIELGGECLGVHSGEARGEEGSNLLGFARVRIGADDPADVVELVRQPRTDPAAIACARELFAAAGLEVALCADFAGRIIDRLIRPFFNDALRRLDEGLASAEDLDLSLRLGLGYPVGPIELLERSGVAAHHDVTKALFEIYGQPALAPARRAVVARQREPKD